MHPVYPHHHFMPSVTSSAASSSAHPIPFPEHNIYMGEFVRLNTHYISLQKEVGKIYIGIVEHTSDFKDYVRS